MSDLQFMPDQTPEALAVLRADILEHGIQVPVVKDQHGRILDGNNRAAIADQLGIDYPVEVVHVADDEEAEDRAISLNLKRRSISQAQMRELIADQIDRHPDMSDRAIAKRLGCSHPTVASVRKGGKSFHPDAAELEDARARAERVVTAMSGFHENIVGVVYWLMSNGVEQIRIIRALRNGKKMMTQHEPVELWSVLASHCYETFIDMVLDEAVVAETYVQAEGPAFLPLEEEFVLETLARLADPFASDISTRLADGPPQDL
ncbi:ParB N-terminal domain-containing protein [Leucobacter sp. HNU]|uniref:ParB N-terminal domain-containing protein n=1 Tax=Leucobacter sp. HNU TaxID=3236805 RepID=UPI003A8070FC